MSKNLKPRTALKPKGNVSLYQRNCVDLKYVYRDCCAGRVAAHFIDTVHKDRELPYHYQQLVFQFIPHEAANISGTCIITAPNLRLPMYHKAYFKITFFISLDIIYQNYGGKGSKPSTIKVFAFVKYVLNVNQEVL